MLVVAIAAAGVVLVTFVFTTLIREPASIVTLFVILALSVVLDFGWKRVRANRVKPSDLKRSLERQSFGTERYVVEVVALGLTPPFEAE